MNKVVKGAAIIASISGITYGIWKVMMNNPKMMNQIKKASKTSLHKTADMLDNMAMDM